MTRRVAEEQAVLGEPPRPFLSVGVAVPRQAHGNRSGPRIPDNSLQVCGQFGALFSPGVLLVAVPVRTTAGATLAYRHYLALRENPDPLRQPPWDSVRVELAALVTR